MSSNTKKIIFYTLWLLVVLIGPATVIKDSKLSFVLASQAATINFLQRIVGTTAFAMLVVQILVGSQMKYLTQKLGAWVFSFHLFEGPLVYSLILLHPFLFVLFNYKIKGVFDPFFVYTDLCALCQTRLDFLYNFGRIAFWLTTAAVTAAKFRTSPYLRKNWRSLHVLNYLAFFAVAYHSWNLGTDTQMTPFVYLYWTGLAVVSGSLLLRLKRLKVQEI